MGRVVIGLQKGNFNIYDQGNPEVIRNFSTEDTPISLGIIFDASSSMHEKIDRSREAVIQLLRRSNPQDEFFLIGFNDSPRLLVDFTNSIEEVQEAIAKTHADGRTALLDALYLGLEQLKKARYERKALMIVSDGGDNHSRYTTREVWSVLTEADVQVYAMGLFDEAPRTKAERRGPDLLASTTSVTGGETIPIRNLKKIGDAVEKLSTEMRNQYLIAYHPDNLVHDGKWHKIAVRVIPPQNSPPQRVFAKAGYYAPR
jgi:Ca-activated chloride channel family protein